MRSAGLLLLCCATVSAGAGQPQQFPRVAAGTTVRIVVPVPSAGGEPARVRVKAGDGVTVDAVTRLVRERSTEIAFLAKLREDTPGGLFTIASLISTSDGGPTAVTHCYVWVVAPEALPVDGSLPVVDSLPIVDSLPVVESLPIAAPPPTASTASPAAAPTPVQRLPAVPQLPARSRAAANTLKGVAYAGATELGLSGRSEPEAGYGIDLSGRVANGVQMNALYVHGWNPGLSPVFRYGMHESRGHLRLKAPSWGFQAGEIRQETPLAGVVTAADGASFEKTGGLLIGSLVVARPKYFAGGWGGHLFQGSLGLGFANGAISVVGSDLARPVPSSRVLATGQGADENSELVVEDLERVGALLSRENRIRSGGIESRFTFGGHRISARGGWLDLVDTEGRQASGPTASGNYSFRAARGSLTGSFRTSPPGLPGMALPGNRANLGGKIELAGPLALSSRTFWYQTSLFGRPSPTTGVGGSVGLEYSTNPTAARFYLQGNYRELQYLSTTVTRSITAGLRLPMGITGFDAALELGEAAAGGRRRRIAIYRGSFYVEGEHGGLMFVGSYRDYGIANPRVSLDLSGSFEWRGALLEAGTGISRTGIFGDVFNAWTTVEVPLPGGLAVVLGADYDRWSFEESPYLIFLMDDPTPPWRFTFNVKKQLAIPLPK